MRRTNLAGAMRLLGASKALGCALEHLNPTTFAPFPPALRALSASGSACSGGSNMALIKKLRDQSGAPISDVKKALEETNWDLSKASEELRKKGLSAASKKASRSATEGLVGLASSGHGVAIVELNSETDFVARNQLFTSVVSRAAQALLEDHGARQSRGSGNRGNSGNSGNSGAAGEHCVWNVDAETLGAIVVEGGSLSEAVQEVAGTVRENIKLRRGVVLESVEGASLGVVGTYVHSKVPGAPMCGRIAGAVLLGLGGGQGEQGDVSKLEDTANKLAMHVVGSVPKYLNRASVPAADLEKERQLLMEQAGTSGKPANIVEKMVEGRLNKFYQEHCLLEQAFVMDDKKRVKDVVRELGGNVALQGFVRVTVEGE